MKVGLIPIFQMIDSRGSFPLLAPEFLYGRGFGVGSHLLEGGGDGKGVKTAFQHKEEKISTVLTEEWRPGVLITLPCFPSCPL